MQSALQYPRTLVLGGVPYDNCAVMIHEGPNADSGHYYDLIKHPGTGQWFTYNDEVGLISKGSYFLIFCFSIFTFL